MRVGLLSAVVVLAVLGRADAWIQALTGARAPALDSGSEKREIKKIKLPEAEVSVTTIKAKSSTVQIPAPPLVTPEVEGHVNTKLDRYACVTVDPFPTENPFQVGKPSPPPPATNTYTAPTTINNARLGKRSASPDPKKANKMNSKRQFGGGTFADLFTPIAITSPPAIFSRRSTHPAPRLSIAEKDKPFETNKFYSNLYLGQQDRPVFSYPYSVWWSKGNPDPVNNTLREPFGLSISHVDQDQRVFGPTGSVGSGNTGAVEYYLSPIWIRSMHLGAIEFNPATGAPSMELTELGPMSVMVDFYVNKTYNATAKMRTPLCLGMGFISAEYNGLTPVIESSVLFRQVAVVSSEPDVVKYKVTLEDGKKWVIYGHQDVAAGPSVPLVLTVVNNGKLEASGPFYGRIQIAKIGVNEDAYTESVLDQATGGICTRAVVTGQASGSVGSYQINYTRYKGKGPLLMFALPHHVNSFTDSTKAATRASYQLTSLSKGMMKAVIADDWSMQETEMPTNIGWLPVKSGAAPVFPAAALTQISTVARAEIAQDFDAQSNLDEFYFSGKALGKFAYMCLTAHLILADKTLTVTCLNKLKKSYSTFTSGLNKNKLVYEYGWRGIVTDAVYKTGNPAIDFGGGYYNDHHFHYSYFIHTGAVIAWLDHPTRAGDGTWLNKNKDWVNSLVRDISNPSPQDPYFPVSRNFDFWHGHSWAKGLFESLDGKDEESSSEDAAFAYAIKMWGYASAQPVMEARGNLMLAILRRSLNTYMLISPKTSPHPTNPDPWGIHPASFNPNRVTGILFENKVHHITYFGGEPKHIQGIHMIPLSPISPYIRSAAFAQDEWNAFFAGKTGAINDGWKGILYQNVALFSPKDSWAFFKQSGFRTAWLDGGASRTWSLAFAGMLGGAQ